ncbi:MAG: hypothetical protein ABL901_14325 [Hyphomicrobiaceae bacterium]
MSEITDEMLMAFADGQLATADRRKVADYIADRPEARARVEMFKRTSVELATMFNAALVEPVPGKLLATITNAPAQPSGRASFASTEKLKTASVVTSFIEAIFPSWPTLMTTGAFAATLAIGALIGSNWHSPRPSAIQWQDTVALNEGRILAKDNFHEGLEKTPIGSKLAMDSASARLVFTPVLTFERKDGGYCRSYTIENAAGLLLAGVACRNAAGDWTLEIQRDLGHVGQTQNGVQTAGKPVSPAIEAAIDKLMRGNVLTKEKEAQVLAGHWQR